MLTRIVEIHSLIPTFASPANANRGNMPLYLRAQQLDIPTPTISSVASDDEDNFLTDPEQMFDELPQPFRMINKILDEIVGISWDKIAALEKEKELEAKRIKPPVYKPSGSLEHVDKVSCACSITDDKLYVGTHTSLMLLDKDGREVLSWQPEEEVSVEHVSCTKLGSFDMTLLSIIDDMGFARLLIHAGDMFHHITVLNELVEGTPKSNVINCEISKGGDYCGVALESNKKSWLEFYKLPIESWNKEIENARKEFSKRNESMAATSSEEIQEENPKLQTTSSESLFPSIKFSPQLLVLKVNGPLPISGSNARRPSEMMDEVGTGEVLGDGTSHGITGTALEYHTKLFQLLNEDNLQYAEEISTTVNIPTFHFLQPSSMEPITQSKIDTDFTHVGIWWMGNHNFSIYQLNKAGKSVEFQPDSVWPQSCNITSTAISDCNMFLALGVESGSVTVWNRKLALVESVTMVSNNIRIVSTEFVHSFSDEDDVQTDKQTISLLVGSGNGQVSLLDCCCNTPDALSIVVTVSSIMEEKFTVLKTLPYLPELFLTVDQVGEFCLKNSLSGDIVCKLSLPEEYQLEPPFETSFILSSAGDILYIRGNEISDPSKSLMFLYHLRSFPTLDPYKSLHGEEKQCISSPTMTVGLMEQVQDLLTKRLLMQADRTSVLKSRWHVMHNQLEFILNLKETLARRSKETACSKSSTPAARWSKTTSRVIAHNKDLKL